MKHPRRPRTLIFCVSEMAPDLLERWMDDLPTLARLSRKGVHGRTRYDTPYYLTPQMWATINTGTRPGTHGLFDYRQRFADGSFRETRGSDVTAPPWWHVLEDAGFTVGVVNLPLTYPPAMTRGFMISGQDAPGSHATIMTPESLYEEINKAFGRYHLKDIFPGGQYKKKYRSNLAEEINYQTELYSWICKNNKWDCLTLYTPCIAMAQHYYWNDMIDGTNFRDVIYEAYVAVDKMLAQVIASAGDEPMNICVMSECGAGQLSYGVNLNRALHETGFLHYKGSASPKVQYRKIERIILSKIRSMAQRHLPKSLFYLANRSFVRKLILERLATQGIDWSRTRAFHRGKGEGNIYLNMRGRDPQGIVSPADRPALIAELSEMLLNLETPEGERPVVAVHRREELFSGPHLERAPDLVIEWRNAAFMPNEKDHENAPLFGPRWREYMNWPTSGSHRPEGVFIAAGPSIAQCNDIAPIGLPDLAQFWLALHEVPAPASMEGALRAELLSGNREE